MNITLKYGESASELLSPLIMLIPYHKISTSFAQTLHYPANTDIKSMQELAATVITQIDDNQAIKKAKKKDMVRDNIPVIYGCTYTHTPSNQKNGLANANDDRSIICLDFDEDGQDVDAILSLLSQYTYFGWTTKSNTIENPRFTVIIPLSTEIDQSTWRKNRIALGLAIKGMGLTVDGSCAEYIQARFMPTPGISDVTYFANAGTAIDYHSLIASVPQDDIDAIVNKAKAHEQAIIDKAMGMCVQHATSENGKYDDVIRKNLNSSNVDLMAMGAISKARGKLNRNQRYGWAQAFCYFGRYDLFDQFDKTVRKVDTKTTTKALLSAATSAPHPNMLFSNITIEQLKIWGIIPAGEEDVLCEYAWDRLFDKDDYLSVEHYGKKQSVLMVADVNSGKNYCWQNYNEMNPGRVIVLSPLTAIVRQSDNSDDANTVDIANGNYKWSLVYDKAEKLIELFAAGTSKIKPEEITLVIDEVHNLSTATYRGEAITAVMDLIKSQKWKKVIYQSATVDVPSFRATIDVEEVIRFKKKVQRKINYHRVPQMTVPDPDVVEGYRKIPNTIPALNIIIDAVAKGKKVIVLNNDKTGNAAMRRALKTYADDAGTTINTAEVNRDLIRTYGTTANDMANNQDFCMGDIEVLIGTYSLVEGINIKDDIRDAVAVVIGPEDVSYVVQLAGRFRKANTINLYHIFGNGTTTGSIADMVNKIDWINKEKQKYALGAIAKAKAEHGGVLLLEEIDALSMDLAKSASQVDGALYKIGLIQDQEIMRDNILQHQQDYINARKAVFHSDSAKRNIICKLYGMTPTDYIAVNDCIDEDDWNDAIKIVSTKSKIASSNKLAEIDAKYHDFGGCAEEIKKATKASDDYSVLIDLICASESNYLIFVDHMHTRVERIIKKIESMKIASSASSNSHTFTRTIRDVFETELAAISHVPVTANWLTEKIESTITVFAMNHGLSLEAAIKTICKIDNKAAVSGSGVVFTGRPKVFLSDYAISATEAGKAPVDPVTGKRPKIYTVSVDKLAVI